MQQLKIFLFLLSVNSQVYATDKLSESFIADLTENSAKLFCNDQNTLKYMNMNKSECQANFNSLAVDCNFSLKETFPKFEGYEDAKMNFNKIQNFAFLYYTCLKLKIYESKEHVKFLPKEPMEPME